MTVWTAGAAGAVHDRVGWTVSSVIVADGEPAEVVGLVDEDSALADHLESHDTVVINLVGVDHRALADAFAGQSPAPGGAFRLGTWADSAWGPTLLAAPGWLGVRITDHHAHAGWSLLVRGRIEHVEVGDDDQPALGYLRGRYRDWPL